MSGGDFAAGLLGAIGGKAVDAMHQHDVAEAEKRKSLAQHYLDIMNDDSIPEDDPRKQAATESFNALYKHSKPIQQIGQKLGNVLKIGKALNQGSQKAAAAAQTPTQMDASAGSPISPTSKPNVNAASPIPMSEKTPIGGSSTQIPPTPPGGFNYPTYAKRPADQGGPPDVPMQQKPTPPPGASPKAPGTGGTSSSHSVPQMSGASFSFNAGQQKGAAEEDKDELPRTLAEVRAATKRRIALKDTEEGYKQAIKLRKQEAEQIGLKPGTREYEDYVLTGEKGLAASRKTPTTPLGMWYQAKRDAGEEPTPDEIIKKAQELRPAKALTPIQEEQKRAFDALHRGDMKTAEESFNALKRAVTTKGAPDNFATWVSKSVNGTPDEQAEAKAKIAEYQKVQSAIGAARFIAGAQARAMFQNVYTVDEETGEGKSMSLFNLYQARLAGKTLTAIPAPSFQTAAGLQKFVKEAPAAIASLRDPIKNAKGEVIGKSPLDAFDNDSDRLIFARVLGDVGPRPSGDDVEREWAGKVLDQIIKGKEQLTPEGRELFTSLARMKDTVFTVQTALGAQKTDMATEMFMAMLPGGSTPDAAMAKRQVWQFEQNAKNSLTPIMKGIVQVPPEWRDSPEANGSAKPTPPPAAGNGKLSKAAQDYLDSQGIPH